MVPINICGHVLQPPRPTPRPFRQVATQVAVPHTFQSCALSQGQVMEVEGRVQVQELEQAQAQPLLFESPAPTSSSVSTSFGTSSPTARST
jgi:hypothetical protein